MLFFSLNSLKLAHEFAINIIFNTESETTAKQNPPLLEYTGTISQIEYQKVVASRIKHLKVRTFQGGHRVVVNNRSTKVPPLFFTTSLVAKRISSGW